MSVADPLERHQRRATEDVDQLRHYRVARQSLERCIALHRERGEDDHADALTRLHTTIGTLALRWREGRPADE